MILLSRTAIKFRCIAPLRFLRLGLRFASQLPEYLEITMPALSPTMSKGGLAAWNKQVGDKISPGDKIAEIETDKATVDFEAQEEGYLAKQLIEQGTTDIPVGKLLGILVEDESDVSKFENFSPDTAERATPKDAASSVTSPSVSTASFPPHQLLTMPALSPTMTKGQVAQWIKKKGDDVKVGDVIAQIETDKATVDLESIEDGYIAKILIDAGIPDIEVGKPIAVLVDDGTMIEAFHDFLPESEQASPKPTAAASPRPAPKPASSPTQPSQANRSAENSAVAKGTACGRVITSPYARKIASENNIDIRQIAPSGPNNRIVARDVEMFLASGSGHGAETVGNEEAESVAISMQTIPHYYLTAKVNADAILKLVASESTDNSISFRDFIVKASAAALRDIPIVNSRWNGDSIRQFQYVDIGVQMVNDEGRITTYVVADADLKGLREIASAKSKQAPASLATFTLSSIQGPGVSQVSAIIAPSQAAILALGHVESKVVASCDATWKQAKVFQATLSCDHRIIDGAVGAQWLQAFKRYCEDPFSLLL